MARKNLGDYKLKTASDYVIPVEERMNTETKRAQIVKLRRRIYDAKAAFNHYCGKVRAAKLEAIAELEVVRARLIDVLSELGEPIIVPAVPTCDDDEFPERGSEYTTETLRQFKVEMAKEEEAAAAAAKAGGGFGGLGDGGGSSGGQKGGGGGGSGSGGGGGGDGDAASGDNDGDNSGSQLSDAAILSSSGVATTVEAPPSCVPQNTRTTTLARPAAYVNSIPVKTILIFELLHVQTILLLSIV